MDHRGRRQAPYEAAYLLGAWATANLSWVRGTAALRGAGLDFLELPATLAFDVIYSLLLEETQEAVDAREKLNERLDNVGIGGRPDRATWGLLPSHQQQMRRAAAAAGQA